MVVGDTFVVMLAVVAGIKAHKYVSYLCCRQARLASLDRAPTLKGTVAAAIGGKKEKNVM
jgi:hypothetical protein